jgi:ABC-2 type transport system permease protein
MNWAQLRTILWLRWHLTRNQWRRGGAVAETLSLLLITGAVILALAGFAGGLWAGQSALAHQPPSVLLLVWDAVTVGFLFFWAIGLLTELQRAESIDLPRLMHLPVLLGQVFVINYLASHVTLSLLVALPVMIGLALGLTLSHGPALLLLLPLSLSLIFMVTAWTYCLRGWLAALMVNQRRRRTIVVLLTMVLVLVGQLPNFYFNVIRSASRPKATRSVTSPKERVGPENDRSTDLPASLIKLATAHQFIPLLWLPNGAWRLAEGRWLPALLGTLGGLALGGLGLHRAYRSTVRFYHGEVSAKVVATAEAAAAAPALATKRERRSRFMESRWHLVPESATALALATLRSMMRAPEVKMALGMPILMTLVFGAIFFARAPGNTPQPVKPFLATGAATFVLFFLFQLFANQFGYDRHGFRSLVLSPVRRKDLLLGKNLALVPVALILGGLFLVVASAWAAVPVLAVVAAVFQLLALTLIVSVAGNLVSILTPYRIQPGSMKATKLPVKTMLMTFVCMVLFPLLVAPAFVPPLAELLWRLGGGSTLFPLNLLLSFGLAILVSLAYWCSLAPLGRLLHRREIEILGVVTTDVE